MMLNKRATLLATCLTHVNKSFGMVFQSMSTKSETQFETSQTSHAERTKIQNEEPEIKNNASLQKESTKGHIDSNAIIKYISDIDASVIKDIPAPYIKYSKSINNPLLIDKNAAQKFVSLIIDDLLTNPCFVVQASANLGIMTRALLNAGVPFIHVYEELVFFRQKIEPLLTEFPGRLEIRNYNFTKLSKIMYVDNMTNDQHLQKALRGVPKHDWEDKSSMQIIATIYNDTFIRQLIMNLVFSNCIMVYGRPVVYAVIKPSIWKKYTAKTERFVGTTTVLFQLFFNWEKLGEVSRKSYLPWVVRKNIRNKSKQELLADDADLLFVVKMEPKADIFTNIISRKELVPFWHFLRHNLIMKKKRVIPEMEKLIPDCGIKLIMMDYTIYTEFSDLTSTQLLELYQEITSWPEFESSAFLDSVDAVVSRMDENLIAHGNYD